MSWTFQGTAYQTKRDYCAAIVREWLSPSGLVTHEFVRKSFAEISDAELADQVIAACEPDVRSLIPVEIHPRRGRNSVAGGSRRRRRKVTDSGRLLSGDMTAGAWAYLGAFFCRYGKKERAEALAGC